MKPRLQGFTFIEILIVLGIMSIFIVTSFFSYTSIRKRSRDTKRKSDLETITVLLNAYYADYGVFPPASNASSSCAYGTPDCWVFSTAGVDWIESLVPPSDPYYASLLPLDPTNNAEDPWDLLLDNYSYAYGNVSADGQSYDLTTRLESENDPARCANAQYVYGFSNTLWCGAYSGQIYEFSPQTP